MNPPTDERADTWVVVPTYNNGGTLRDVVGRCLARLPRVLVVDDGSTDGDARETLRGMGAAVLRHEKNMGKGAALMTAFDWLAKAGARFAIALDADGQHFPEDIDRFLPELDENTILVGSRDVVLGDMPGKSRFGRAFSDFWVLIETGQAVSDTQSGFRAYPVQKMAQLPLRARRYDFEIEALARAAWAGLSIRSVPVRVWYAPAGQRVSSFRPFMDNLRISLTHTRLIGRKLWPWPIKRLVPKPYSAAEIFRRPKTVLRRMLKENATPLGLAISAAAGMFLGALPLLGTHMLAILYVTVRLGLNKVMALSIQNLCMPPVVPGTCIAIGYFMRHGRVITSESLRDLARAPVDRALEWVLGSLVVAPALALASGVVVYALAAWTQTRRRAEDKGPDDEDDPGSSSQGEHRSQERIARLGQES